MALQTDFVLGHQMTMQKVIWVIQPQFISKIIFPDLNNTFGTSLIFLSF